MIIKSWSLPLFVFQMPITGGISDQDKPATPEVQGLVEQLKSQIAGKANAAYEVFEATVYRTQVVAGVNYFIKVGHTIA